MSKDIVATTGSYEKDGEKKYITRNVGKVVTTKEGYEKIVLEASFNPAGCKVSEDGKVWLSIFEKKENKQDEYNDSIPF